MFYASSLPEALPVNRKTYFVASNLGDFYSASLNKSRAWAASVGNELDSKARIDLSPDWSRANARGHPRACEPLRAPGVPDTPSPRPLAWVMKDCDRSTWT